LKLLDEMSKRESPLVMMVLLLAHLRLSFRCAVALQDLTELG